MRKNSKYISEEELIEQWQLWIESAQKPEDRTIPNKLVEQIYLMARHLLEHPRFVRYPAHMKDDMTQEGVIKVCKNLKNFKPSKGRLFNYATTCLWTAFIVHLGKYYKEQNQKREQILDALNSIDEKQIVSIKYLHELLGDLQETVESYRDKEEIGE